MDLIASSLIAIALMIGGVAAVLLVYIAYQLFSKFPIAILIVVIFIVLTIAVKIFTDWLDKEKKEKF